jgi:hypothetical protein
VDSLSGSSLTPIAASDAAAFAPVRSDPSHFGQLQLNAASSDFEVTLFLHASGRKVGIGTGDSARHRAQRYTVVVNALEPGQLGKFSLSSGCLPEPVRYARHHSDGSGQLAPRSSCRLLNNTPMTVIG